MVHVMDGLGQRGKLGHRYRVKFLLISKASSASVETRPTVSLRHLYWDEKLDLCMDDSFLEDDACTISLHLQPDMAGDGREPQWQSERKFRELIASLVGIGLRRKEIVFSVKLEQDPSQPQHLDSSHRSDAVADIRLRLGLLWIPASLKNSSEALTAQSLFSSSSAPTMFNKIQTNFAATATSLSMPSPTASNSPSVAAGRKSMQSVGVLGELKALVVHVRGQSKGDVPCVPFLDFLKQYVSKSAFNEVFKLSEQLAKSSPNEFAELEGLAEGFRMMSDGSGFGFSEEAATAYVRRKLALDVLDVRSEGRDRAELKAAMAELDSTMSKIEAEIRVVSQSFGLPVSKDAITIGEGGRGLLGGDLAQLSTEAQLLFDSHEHGAAISNATRLRPEHLMTAITSKVGASNGVGSDGEGLLPPPTAPLDRLLESAASLRKQIKEVQGLAEPLLAISNEFVVEAEKKATLWGDSHSASDGIAASPNASPSPSSMPTPTPPPAGGAKALGPAQEVGLQCLEALRRVTGRTEALKGALRAISDAIFGAIAASKSKAQVSVNSLLTAGDCYKELMESMADLRKVEKKIAATMKAVETHLPRPRATSVTSKGKGKGVDEEQLMDPDVDLLDKGAEARAGKGKGVGTGTGTSMDSDGERCSIESKEKATATAMADVGSWPPAGGTQFHPPDVLEESLDGSAPSVDHCISSTAYSLTVRFPDRSLTRTDKKLRLILSPPRGLPSGTDGDKGEGGLSSLGQGQRDAHWLAAVMAEALTASLFTRSVSAVIKAGHSQAHTLGGGTDEMMTIDLGDLHGGDGVHRAESKKERNTKSKDKATFSPSVVCKAAVGTVLYHVCSSVAGGTPYPLTRSSTPSITSSTTPLNTSSNAPSEDALFDDAIALACDVDYLIAGGVLLLRGLDAGTRLDYVSMLVLLAVAQSPLRSRAAPQASKSLAPAPAPTFAFIDVINALCSSFNAGFDAPLLLAAAYVLSGDMARQSGQV